MPLLELATQDFESVDANVPRVKVSNLYLMENPASLSGVSYLPRPSLQSFCDFGPAKIRGVYYQSKAGTTNIYIVADNTLYEVSLSGNKTALGFIAGSGFCTFASTIFHIAISTGVELYLYNSDVLLQVELPDNLQPTDVSSLDNYFIVGIKNTTKLFWINPGEVVVDGLSFFSAERNPDDVISVMSSGDELWVLGQQTCEVFVSNGDSNSPFLRISGRSYLTGCASRTSVVRAVKDSLPCLLWVTDTNQVVLAQGGLSYISTASVEEHLKKSSEITAWSFRSNKHDFYVLCTGAVTLVYDLTTGLWCNWSTYGKTYWEAILGTQVNDTGYAISVDRSGLFKLVSGNSDGPNEYLICEVSGYIPHQNRSPAPCYDITVFINYGFSDSYTSSPTIEMRWSDDLGNSWSPYSQGFSGLRGLYKTEASFRSLGLIRRPGRYVEFRFTEDQNFRIDGAQYNAD